MNTTQTQLETSTSTNTTAAIATNSVDASLIGGIVGGVVALLLVCGLIAFFVARSRRRVKDEPSNDAAMQSARDNASAPTDYAPFVLNNYDVVPQQTNYDAWPNETSSNRTEYEDFTKIN
jgi:hypothetical protein